VFHELLFQVAGAANWLPGFYYLWGGMNDSRVKWFLSADDYETLSDGSICPRGGDWTSNPAAIIHLVTKFPEHI